MMQDRDGYYPFLIMNTKLQHSDPAAPLASQQTSEDRLRKQ
ncbi:hypothetical protein AS9A_P20010 (plasmid) [Hoyosella subflava DQS3-9A1]|uniref:Uncharacterized protein n=1 Tax=Hoyosella subflava (strain DSM 45089 / JCM 17490 / NBRC 109087 / DQS3-9A1) TaxID=443218 RepID=F6ESD3_HOYSD|nr:hypothetical protein AS9A_P20010 [Hoyosella subflava DQS3-9A1]